MGVFDEDIQTAKEMIAEFGQTCYWWPAPMIVQSPQPGYPTEVDAGGPFEVKIAFFSARDLARGTFEFLDLREGTEVPEGAEIGLMAGGISFTPRLVDGISRGSQAAPRVAIHDIDRLAPNGEPVLYYITVKP